MLFIRALAEILGSTPVSGFLFPQIVVQAIGMQLHNPPLRRTFRTQGLEAQPSILQADPQQVMIEFF